MEAAITAMLKAEGLTKHYGKKAALQDLDFEVRAGEVVALLGANGAGKTTTIKLLLGLIRPTAGKSWIAGRCSGDPAARGLAAYSPESPRFHEFLTAEETLAYYAELGGLPREGRAAQVAKALEMTGLAHVRSTKAGRLSKGEAQRLSVAQALLGDPPILLLDEPTSGLDPAGRVAMRELLEQCKARGKTILLNSHILSDVERVCGRAMILRRGRLAWQGRLEEVSGRGNVLEVRAEGWGPAAERALDAEGFRWARKEGCWEVSPCTPAETHRAARALMSAGVRLQALIPRGGSLEELFLELNGGNNNAGDNQNHRA